MFWEKDIELMPEGDLRSLQAARLKATLRRAMNTPFYSKRFGELGLKPEDVKSLDDLKKIPFTTKEDLREGFPYGFLAVPKEHIIRMHSSSGTTGQITVIFHTKRDIDNWANLVARCMYMTGVRAGDVFQNMMSYGLFTGGLGFHYGAERIGAMTIPAGSGNSRRQIFLMKHLETTVIHIIPSYALTLPAAFAEAGIDPKKDLKLKIAFLGAEPHSEATRRKIEEIYGLDAFNSYGLSEMNGPGVAFECPYKDGMHVWEDSFILEVINPQTLEAVPDGDEGELVFTTLTREATPILRYRTKDLAYVYPERCRCGRVHRRISRIKGRTDDMFIVKGVNVFPMQIERVLMNIPGVGNNYVILLERENYRDEIIVQVEVSPEIFTGEIQALDRLRDRIIEELKAEILVTPKVRLVEPGTLQATEGKAVRVIDNRKL